VHHPCMNWVEMASTRPALSRRGGAPFRSLSIRFDRRPGPDQAVSPMVHVGRSAVDCVAYCFLDLRVEHPQVSGTQDPLR